MKSWHLRFRVAPFTGAWIEINTVSMYLNTAWVAPFTGAWIEIRRNRPRYCKNESLPSRERGLKSAYSSTYSSQILVAPFTGAWIEIQSACYHNIIKIVAPFTGAWIEMYSSCVLKRRAPVAPFTGAWIEIHTQRTRRSRLRSLPSRERGLKF